MAISNTGVTLPYINLSMPEFTELQVISDGVDAATAYASSALEQANGFLQNLTDILGQVQDIPEISTEIGAIDKVITAITLPDDPTQPAGLDYANINQPAEPTFDTVTAPVLPDPPEFTAERPTVTYPAKPGSISAAVPASPALNDVNLPEAPTITLPSEPSLLAIDIPATPVIDLPVFSATQPAVPDSPLVPDFAFNEPEYISSLLSSLQTLLQEWVDGASTGLSADVEQKLFDRSRSREDAASLRTREEVIRNFSNSGFPAPPGAMQSMLLNAARETSDKVSAINRDITIQVAELEQANRKFAIEKSTQLEGILIQRADGVANRALQAAQITVTSAISLYQIIVSRYQAQLAGFQTEAAVYETLVRAAISKLEIYRGQLEGQQLIGNLNESAVKIYAERVNAVISTIETYKAQVSAAEVASNINRNIIARFGEEVNAYQAQVAAKAAEYDAYAKELQAEIYKLDGYKTDADVFKSRIDGFQSLVQARSLEKDIEYRVKQENPVNLYRARIEAFSSLVGAERDRVQSLATVYDSDIRRYAAKVDGLAKLNRGDIDEYQAKGQLMIQEAQTNLQVLSANVERLARIMVTATEVARSGGAISAQLAASAMSMLNFSQTVSQSDNQSRSQSYTASESNSTSTARSDSVSWNYNYSYAVDTGSYSLSQLNTY